MRYLRSDHQAPEQVQELTEDIWMDYARSFTIDTDIAREHGFDSYGCHYWIEVSA